jgi:hypothetical protein
LQALLEAVDDRVSIINEPKRVECGAPDYIITRARAPIGYVEAKDVGASLDTAERSEQMRRYHRGKILSRWRSRMRPILNQLG